MTSFEDGGLIFGIKRECASPDDLRYVHKRTLYLMVPFDQHASPSERLYLQK